MATLLPNGKQQFFSSIGVPLVGGKVYFYIPGTTTPKDTYQDAGGLILNTNPVTLDSAGEAVIYGSGAYRQLVKDALGNIVWDQITSDTSSATSSWAGTSGGTGNAITVSAANFTSSDGQQISFNAGFTNTGATTLNVNGIGPLPVVRDLATGVSVLAGGEIVSGNIVTMTYDTTLGSFHLSSFPTLKTATGTIMGNVSGSSAVPSAIAVADFVAASTFMPVGMIAPFPVSTAPGTWLELAGQLVSRVTYFPLWTFANGSGNIVAEAAWAANSGGFSTGDTTTTFRLPDFRGEFVRGWDNGRGIDAGRTIGSAQGDQVQDHTHLVGFHTTGTATGASEILQNFAGSPGQYQSGPPNSGNHGTETRPRNVAVMWCIKT